MATKEQISHELIKRGSIRHLLHGGQKKFYDQIKTNPQQVEHFMMASRRFGKSYMLALIGVEHCLNEPTARVRHVFPVITTGKKALFDIMGQIIPMLPSDLRPKLNRTDATYTFPNGALYMVGSAHPSTIDNLRGTATTMLLGDEIAFWAAESFDEVLYSILYPQMLHYKERKVIFITTPPPTITHPAIASVLERVRNAGFYTGATIYDNPRLLPAEIENMKEMVGGENSNAWRREFLVELIADDSLRLVPEFDVEKHVGTVEMVDSFGNKLLPEPYIGVDVGLVDDTAYVAGYYDYSRQKYVITAEKTCNYKAFPELFQNYNDLVSINFPQKDFLDPVCVLDIFPIAAHDLRTTYNWVFRNPSKGQISESIAWLRDCFISDKIIIDPKCEKLIYQLKTAIWAENRKEVARNADQSHADLIMSLTYITKAIPWNSRPTDINPLKFNRLSGVKRR